MMPDDPADASKDETCCRRSISAERAKVVEWLRSPNSLGFGTTKSLANAIERGDHLKSKTP